MKKHFWTCAVLLFAFCTSAAAAVAETIDLKGDLADGKVRSGDLSETSAGHINTTFTFTVSSSVVVNFRFTDTYDAAKAKIGLTVIKDTTSKPFGDKTGNSLEGHFIARPTFSYSLVLIAIADPAPSTLLATPLISRGTYSISAVAPLPPAGLAFLTSIGGLAALRFRRQSLLWA